MKKSPAMPGGPRWSGHLNREAGRWAKATGARKNAASAQGLTPQRESQIRSGCPTGAPQRFYTLLDQLARGGRTDPFPLLAGAHTTVEDALASAGSVEGLRDALFQSLHEKREREADTGVATMRFLVSHSREDLEAIVAAGELEASVLLRLLGVSQVMIRREG